MLYTGAGDWARELCSLPRRRSGAAGNGGTASSRA